MKRFKYRIVFLVQPLIALFLLGTMPACAEESSAPPETIILISLDTTRADHLSCYGYEHETTPNIDALAEESLFFEHPFSTAPMTLPSHSSMFTGLIPPTHGVHDNTKFNLSTSALTLAEILKQNGFTTYGIVSTMVLHSDRGIGQGFDYYDDEIETGHLGGDALEASRVGHETTARALQWLGENAQKKKFMFIHYFDPHAQFKPPAPFDAQFKDPYDGEIAFVDFCVGQILDRLKELGLYENALIALVGDHGEMLGEHDEQYHSYFIYQNVLRVPMMFKPPGPIQPKRIKEPTSLIDVTPTLLSMAGLTVPDSMQGVNLAQYLRPEFSLPDRAIFAESMTPTAFACNSLLGIVMGQWHYIQTTRPELYDRIKDPMEMINLAAEYPEQARKMRDLLKGVLAESEFADEENLAVLDAEALEQLEGLGYLGDSVVVDYSFEEDREDAKDMIVVRNQVYSAKRVGRLGQYDLAIESCNEIIEQYPHVAETYKVLSEMYVKLGKMDMAIGVIERSLVQFPDNWEGKLAIAKLYAELEDFKKALEILDELIALKGDIAEPHDVVIKIYRRQKSPRKALEAVQRKRAIFPDDAKTLFTLGKIYQELDDAPNALASFLEMLALNPNSVSGLVSTAATYFKMRNLREALSHYERALAQDADLPDIHGMVARIRMVKVDTELYDPPSALIHAEIALQLHRDKAGGKCDAPVVFDTLSAARAINGDFDKAITAAVRAMELYKSRGAARQAERMKRMIGQYEEKSAKRQ